MGAQGRIRAPEKYVRGRVSRGGVRGTERQMRD